MAGQDALKAANWAIIAQYTSSVEKYIMTYNMTFPWCTGHQRSTKGGGGALMKSIKRLLTKHQPVSSVL